MKYKTKKKIHSRLSLLLFILLLLVFISPNQSVAKISFALMIVVYGVRHLIRDSMRAHFRGVHEKQQEESDSDYVIFWVLSTAQLASIGLIVPLFVHSMGWVSKTLATRTMVGIGLVIVIQTIYVLVRHFREGWKEKKAKDTPARIELPRKSVQRKIRRDFFGNFHQKNKDDNGNPSGSS